MDEEGLIKTGMEVALKPVTDLASDLLGIAGGAWLHEVHMRIRARLRARTEEILKENKVETPAEPAPAIMIPLLTEAQKENRDELVELWARLLAATVDPAKMRHYRRQYVDIVKQLEPTDALLLLGMAEARQYPNQVEFFVERLKTNENEILVSFRNLEQLGVVRTRSGRDVSSGLIMITPIGHELLRVLK